MQSIKECFKEQLKTCNPISEEILSELKGRSLYSDYKVNDKVVSFLYQELSRTTLYRTFYTLKFENGF